LIYVEVEEKKQSLKEKIAILTANKVFFVLLIAEFLRFWGGYSLGFWGSTFYNKVYGEYEVGFVLNLKKSYSIINALIVMIIGSFASTFGGWLGDVGEKKTFKAKGLIAG
jgi:hypothetical protein